jgi:pentatricopeptide repeat protein
MSDTNDDSKLKALEVLHQMREDPESAKPNVISYSTVMNGWAQIGNHERASEVLRIMYDDYVKGNVNAKPDVMAYNTILTAYLRSKEKASWNRAAALIEHMKKISNDGVLAVYPDVFSMSTGMCSLIKYIPEIFF